MHLLYYKFFFKVYISVLIRISFLLSNMFKTNSYIYISYNFLKIIHFFSFLDYLILFVMSFVKNITFLKYLLINFQL